MAARTLAIWMSMRFLRNSFVPANRLPPEILSLIPSSFQSKRDLVNATAVCRYWRNTLLSFPNLWRDVDCSGSRGAFRYYMFRVCLERSWAVPLNVRLASIKYLSDIAPHIARFSTLKIELAVPERFGEIAAYFSRPAPILRELSISTIAPRNQDLSIPPELFGGDFASLRTLRIGGFSALKIPQPLPHLTEFGLQTQEILKTDAMLEMLEWMPSLEVLRVRFCPTHTPHPLSMFTFRSVTLPKLKEVELSSLEGQDPVLPPWIPPFLSALTLPSAEKITVGMLPPKDSLVLPSCFEKQLPNLAETPLVDICIHPKTFSVSFHGRQGAKLQFTARWSTHNRFWREGFRGTPFLSVQKMVVTFDRFFDRLEKYLDGCLFDLLRAMERLECLEMRGRYTRVLELWSNKSPGDQRSLCPSLRSLVVERSPRDPVSGVLARFVKVRRSCGVPLVKAVEVISDE